MLWGQKDFMCEFPRNLGRAEAAEEAALRIPAFTQKPVKSLAQDAADYFLAFTKPRDRSSRNAKDSSNADFSQALFSS